MPLLTSNDGSSQPKAKKHYGVLGLLVLLVLLAVLALVERRNILDWWSLRNYQAPAAILKLAHEDTMTPYALKIFKVNHPIIESKSAFNVNCPNDGGEKTIVLGCYHSDQAGIFLLSVSDPRLDGVEEVTAAHEMLHAAYNRLSTSERNYIDGLLLNYYNHDLHNQRIRADIALYRQTEPHQVVNEMHSVFGTEVANLPKPLENYYKKYFTDRQKITTYADQYEAVFTTRQNEVTADDAQLASMKASIDSQQSQVNANYSAITSEQATLNSEKSSNVSAYNAAVPGYNAQVSSYQAEVTNLKNLISKYNGVVNERNSVALVENQLYGELSGAVGN